MSEKKQEKAEAKQDRELKEEELNKVTGGGNPAVLAQSLVNPVPLGSGGGYGKVEHRSIGIEGVASTTAFRP